MDVELLHFRYSHFNEKARWALDLKRIPHRRRPLLPGPHALTATRLTRQTMVPIVRLDGEALCGSARILEALDAHQPDPPLYPTDADERRRANEIQSWFDDEVGPAVRTALFAVMLDEPAHVCRVFAGAHPPVVRALYRAAFPLVASRMRPAMGLTAKDAAENARVLTLKGLDFVASESGPDGYLVGTAFSVADLTAAALLAPVVSPPGSPMEQPEPVPEAIRRFLEQFAKHPGSAWVRETYRRHRPPSAEIV